MYDEMIKEYLILHKQEMVDDICDLIRINSTRGEPKEGMPYGEGPAKALRKAGKMARSKGFEIRNYDNYVLCIDMNSMPKQLDILGHLDVVPEGEGWTKTKAYSPKIVDGKIYGRGAMDDKGPAIAVMYAMKAIKDLNIPLQRNVRLILGSDEECGSSDLKYYYKHEKKAPMSLSPDAGYPLINLEKGGLGGAITCHYGAENDMASGIIRIKGGEKQNVIPGKAQADIFGIPKSFLERVMNEQSTLTGIIFVVEDKGEYLHIEAKGKTGHAASPQNANNAVTGIIQLLCSLDFDRCEGIDRLKSLNSIFPHGDWRGEAAGVRMEDEISGELTISLNIIDYSPTGFKAVFDSRCPICANDDNMRSVLKKKCMSEGLILEAGDMYPVHYVPEESHLVQTILKCYNRKTVNPTYCIAIGGGTYVHNIENGVAFGAAFPDKDYNVHGPDEYAEIDELIICAELYADVIIQLCSGKEDDYAY